MIVADILVFQFQFQRTQRQVFHAMRTLEEVLVDEGMRLVLLAIVDQLSHTRQVGLRLGTVVIVGRTAPEGLLVELDLFGVRPAIDHRSEGGVAYRQGLQPLTGGLVVP